MWHRDRSAALVELRGEPVEDARDLFVRDESEPSVAHELGVTSALAIHSRQPASERLEERVRARIVVAWREIDVVLAEQPRDLGGRDRADGANAFELGRPRPANVSSYRARSRCASSHASVSAPLRALSDQLVAITRTFLPAIGSRVDGG